MSDGTADQTQVSRIRAFEDRLERAQASSITSVPVGHALFHDSYPSSYMHNRLIVTKDATVSELMRTADEVLGEAGLPHRFISVNGAAGQELAAGFQDEGFDYDDLIVMVHDGRDITPGNTPVRAISFDEIRPALLQHWRHSFPDDSDEAVRQLADRAQLYERCGEVYRLATFEGDQIASRVDLFVDREQRIAQLENLVTNEQLRGRGHAAALLADAYQRVLEAGCDLWFLVADRQDWPQAWYGRSGFQTVTTSHNFILPER